MNVNYIPQDIKRAAINETGTGDKEIVAAVAGKAIVPLFYVLSVSAATTLTWKSNTTALSGAIHFVGTALLPFCPGWCPAGHVKTVAGEALQLASSAAVDVDGHLVYIEV